MTRAFFRPGPRILSTALLLIPALLAGESAASCGLQFCPRPAHHGEAPAWEAGLRTRWVAFDNDAAAGSYFSAAPRLLWRPGAFTVAAEIPFTRLQTGGETRTGLSNALLTALYARRLSPVWSGEAGLQLELPLGDSKKGLADDHTMALPWIGLRRDFGGAWQLSGIIGYAQAVEAGSHGPAAATGLAKAAHDGHDHGSGETVPVLVNPHGDREIHWRAGVARGLGRSTAEGFALGQADVSNGPGHATHYARAGVSWEYALTRAFGLHVMADVPVTAARRSTAEIGAGLKVGL